MVCFVDLQPKFKLITMKKLLMAVLVMAGLSVQAQVKVENGPALENDRDSKMNRMLGGDDNSFYCYRIKTRGKGTSFFVEKYRSICIFMLK